jgi:mannose-1-phosphate guanylyltransferase
MGAQLHVHVAPMYGRWMRHAVILAGGSGTRLWPASRRSKPKQFLPLGHRGSSLLVDAVKRAEMVAEHITVVTSSDLLVLTCDHLTIHSFNHNIAATVNVIAEPAARNTAAAIGLAAATIAKSDPDAVLVVMPADQHVKDEVAFAFVLDLGMLEADAHDTIGTVGIEPTRPETGFGYLEISETRVMNVPTMVSRFVEKPDRERAQLYMESGRHLWNGGIFFAKASRLLTELDARMPATAEAVRALAADPISVDARRLYEAAPSISIDHGIMEQASDVFTIPAAVGWDDVGSWAALSALYEHDEGGNVVVSLNSAPEAITEAVVVDGSNNVIVTDGHTVVGTVGLSEVIVVQIGNAVLVMPKDRAQDVKRVVDELVARGQRLDRYR